MLNLGDINFGLGVDSRGLAQSTQQIQRFGRSVEQATSRASTATKTVAKDAQAAASALLRQEKAALRALQTTQKFQNQASRVGGSASLIQNQARAFDSYISSVTKGTLSTLEFSRAQSKFQADLGRSQRALTSLRAGQQGEGIRSLADAMRSLSNASVLVAGPLSGVGARVSVLSSIMQGTNATTVALTLSFAGLALALGTITTATIRTAVEFDKVNARLLATSGSTAAAADTFEYLKDLADRTGTELVGTANGFAKITAAAAGTKLEGAAAAQVFEDVLFGAAQFRIGTDELNGVLKAFEQIMSKGIVQSEELRGQLGDRLTGAFNIAAKSMGVTTAELNKLLKAGKVASDEFLPAFAAEFRKAVGADQIQRVEGLQASFNRFSNSQTAVAMAFDETFQISQKFQAGVEGLTGVLNFAAANMDNFGVAVAAVAGSLAFLAIPRVITSIVALAGVIRTATTAMLAFNVAILANPLGGLSSILIKVGLAAVGAVAGVALLTDAMTDTSQAHVDLAKSVDEYIKANERANQSDTIRTARQRGEVANRLGFVKAQLDELNALIANPPEVGRGGGATRERNQAKRREQVAALTSEYIQLSGQLEKLTTIQQKQTAAEKARLEVAESFVSTAEQGAIQQIERLRLEAEALEMGTGAIKALKDQFADRDALDKFVSKLEKAGIETSKIDALAIQFISSLNQLRASTEGIALDELNKQLGRMSQELLAFEEGEFALERLKESFAIDDAVSAFEQKLLQAGTSFEVAAFQADAFREQMVAMDQAVQSARAAEAIAEVTSEIDRMNQEAQALEEGEAAVRALQDQFGQTEQIEAFRASLESAGVQGSVLEGIIGGLTGALQRLSAVTGQVKIDAAIQSAADATSRLRAETEALGQGKDAFEAYKNGEKVAANVDNLRTKLESLGASEEEINTALADRKSALEANIAAQNAFNESQKKSRGGGGGGGGGGSAKKTEEEKEAEKELNRLRAIGEQVILRQGGATLELNNKLADLIELQKAGIITQQQYNLEVEHLTGNYTSFANVIQDNADNLASALTDAFGAALQPGADLINILRNLERAIIDVITQALILTPLQNALSAGLSGGGGGGGGGLFGAVGDFLTNLFHEGGSPMEGASARRRVRGPAAALMQAVDTTLKPGESLAVLLNNEEVLTRDDPRHRANGGYQGIEYYHSGGIAGQSADIPGMSRSMRNMSNSNMRNMPSINMTVVTPDANSFKKSQDQITKRMGRTLNATSKRLGG